MRCPNCGADISQGSKYCTRCGTAVPTREPGPRQCANCGAEVGPAETFCTNCGARLATQPSEPPSFGASPPSFNAPGQAVLPATTREEVGDTPQPVPSLVRPATVSHSSPPPLVGDPPRAPAAKILPDLEFKGIGPRIAATVVDTILYFALAWFVASRVGGTTSSGFEFQGIPFALTSLIWLAYYVLLEGYLRGTIGKLALGMRVVNSRGRASGPSAALTRNLLRIVDVLPCFYLLGMLLMATSKQKQRFGDRVAGTFIVSPATAKAMKAANTEIKGAGGTSLVLAMLVLMLMGAGYLLWAQPGPMVQVAGVLSGLPVVGGLIPKASPTPATRGGVEPTSPTAVSWTATPTSGQPLAALIPTSRPIQTRVPTPRPTPTRMPTLQPTRAPQSQPTMAPASSYCWLRSSLQCWES